MPLRLDTTRSRTCAHEAAVDEAPLAAVRELLPPAPPVLLPLARPWLLLGLSWPLCLPFSKVPTARASSSALRAPWRRDIAAAAPGYGCGGLLSLCMHHTVEHCLPSSDRQAFGCEGVKAKPAKSPAGCTNEKSVMIGLKSAVLGHEQPPPNGADAAAFFTLSSVARRTCPHSSCVLVGFSESRALLPLSCPRGA